MEQSVIHPDADAGTQHRDDEGTDGAGGVDADEAEHEFAHKAAEDAQHDVAAGGSVGTHEAVGDVTGQCAHDDAGQQVHHQPDDGEQPHQAADKGKDQCENGENG